MITEEAKEKCRQLLAARDKQDELEAAAAKAKKERDELELDVADMFEEAGIEGTVPVPLGPPYGTVKFRVRKTYYASVADDDKLRAYYEELDELDDVRTEPKWVMKELNSDVREILDKPDGTLPPGLTYYTKRGMTITRPK